MCYTNTSVKEREVFKVLGLKILFYVVAVFLALVFLVAFMNSTAKDRQPRDRYMDLLVGFIVFLVFTILVRDFGRYVF